MRRFRLPGLLNLVVVENGEEIRAFADDLTFDRSYADRSLALNGLVIRRIRRTLEMGERHFPTVAAREAPGRAAAQTALWTRLSAAAEHLATAPDGLDEIAGYVRGESAESGCGPLVQGIVGRIFATGFKATRASWEAALVLDKAPRTMNPMLLGWWQVTRRVERAKRLLAESVGGDLAGVHAVGIAVHNIVSGVECMRALYGDAAGHDGMSAEAAASRCLVAPEVVLRQPTARVSTAQGELTTKTLVLLKLGVANEKTPGGEVAFLRQSWSQCPAERWVPALLVGVWRQACVVLPNVERSEGTTPCPHPRF